MAEEKINLEVQRYFNREFSWLEFNRRVLEEARNENNLLLDRLRFVSIVSSNFDEFFMVRMASFADDDLMAGDIYKRAFELISQRNEYFLGVLVPELTKAGIHRILPQALTEKQTEYLRNLFQKEISPLLTPVAIREDRALPILSNLAIYRFVELREPSQDAPLHYAVIQMPKKASRMIALPAEQGYSFILVEDVVSLFLKEIFAGYEILNQGVLRITRAAEFSLDEEKDEDFAKVMSEALRSRRNSHIVRLEVSATDRMTDFIKTRLSVPDQRVYRNQGWVGLRHLMELVHQPMFESIRRRAWVPKPNLEFDPTGGDIWSVIRERDRWVHHPYESFDCVLRFLADAAQDPDVLAIKQTLYRTDRNSLVIKALEKAAENGKQVTVLLELKARFDEERNIEWARRLENAGASVLYGVAGLKTHAKACLVVRREIDGIRRYVHLATGNYNEKTAEVYSDIGFFSANEALTADVAQFFNVITGFSHPSAFKKIEISPHGLRRRLTRLILREGMRSTKQKPGLIMAKMNSLVDSDIIEALYRVSSQGVQVKLNVRGICCLRPGVKGLSENIEVTSIVDMFLEHTRLFYFQNGGDEEVYFSSADWMPRNLDRRLEILCPVDDVKNRTELTELLKLYYKDNVKSWELLPDGTYSKKTPGSEKPFRVQEYLCKKAEESQSSGQKKTWQELTPQKPKN
ncbi:MAG: polyphosphate kinase 1 [Candidatus Omnitrophica bacterium]|nr:polyphosphate kinase 1 [Candidatus Omnitrophota bacterium]